MADHSASASNRRFNTSAFSAIEALEARIAPATISLNGGAPQSVGTRGVYIIDVSGGNFRVMDGDSVVQFSTSVATALSIDFEGENADTASSGSDNIIIRDLSGFIGSLAIHANAGNDFISFFNTVNFAPDNSLIVDTGTGSDIVEVFGGVTLAATGTGEINLASSKTINLDVNTVLSVVNGDLNVRANETGGTADGGVGVQMFGSKLLSTGTGSIFVVGRGGTNAGGGNYGVFLGNATIQGGTSGLVSVLGIGGSSPGGADHGVLLDGTASITSSGAGVIVTGVGGGIAGGAPSNHGVQIGLSAGNTASVSAGGFASVTITGTGGSGSDENQAVYLYSGGRVSSTFGDVTIVGMGGVGPHHEGIVFNLADSITVGGAGKLVLEADSMKIESINSISADDVTLRPRTPGTLINLGSTTDSAPSTLELSNAELNRITTIGLHVGDATSGRVSVTDVISPAHYRVLESANGLDFAATGGFVADISSATVYEQIIVHSSVNINPSATLTVNAVDGFVPAATDSFTLIINYGFAATAGNFAGKPQGSIVPVGGVPKQIDYAGGSGQDLVLQPPKPTLSVTVAPSAVAEDGTDNLVFTFHREIVTNGDLTAHFRIRGNASLDDYDTFAGPDVSVFTSPGKAQVYEGDVTFHDGETTKTLTINPRADGEVESDEDVVITLDQSLTYLTPANIAIGTITNDDTAVSVAVNPPAQVAEDSGSPLVYTFTRSGVTSGSTTVPFSVLGTADRFTDFLLSLGSNVTYDATTGTGTVTFAAGETVKTLSIIPVADTVAEADETATISVSGAVGNGTGVLSAAVGTILNDDVGVSVSLAPASLKENSGDHFTYTFTRTGPTTGSFNLPFHISGTATLNGDYFVSGATLSGSDGFVTFAPGVSSVDVTVTPYFDQMVERDETVLATITAGSGYTVDVDHAGATATILNDDSHLYVLSESRPGGLIGVGGAPLLRIFDSATGLEQPRIMAYEASYHQGVRTAVGDINGDGIDDIVTATRTGTGRIRIFDGLTHAPITLGGGALSQLNPFTGRQAHGAYVALGDVNGDGHLDIIAGSGLGGGLVKVFDGVTGALIETETPFGPRYTGGIRVASGRCQWRRRRRYHRWPGRARLQGGRLHELVRLRARGRGARS